MNIQQSTITAYTFTLSESELRAAILDPHPLLSQFKLALNGGVTGTESRALVPSNGVGSHLKLGHKRLPKGGGRRGRRATAHSSSRSSTRETLSCSVYHKQFKNQGWLDRHTAAVHATGEPTP